MLDLCIHSDAVALFQESYDLSKFKALAIREAKTIAIFLQVEFGHEIFATTKSGWSFGSRNAKHYKSKPLAIVSYESGILGKWNELRNRRSFLRGELDEVRIRVELKYRIPDTNIFQPSLLETNLMAFGSILATLMLVFEKIRPMLNCRR